MHLSKILAVRTLLRLALAFARTPNDKLIELKIFLKNCFRPPARLYRFTVVLARFRISLFREIEVHIVSSTFPTTLPARGVNALFHYY